MRSAEPGTAPATSKGHGSASRGPAAQSPSFRGRPGGGSKAAGKDPTGGLPPLGAVTTCSERSAIITLANETASVPCRGPKYSSTCRRASFANCTRSDGLLSLVGAEGPSSPSTERVSKLRTPITPPSPLSDYLSLGIKTQARRGCSTINCF